MPPGEDGTAGGELWRQDDGGHRFRMVTYASRAEAEAAMKVYEDRGYKQVYWVERAAGPGAGGGPGGAP